MNIPADHLISFAEANQDFSRVAQLADESGCAVILKNGVPRYCVVPFSQEEDELPVETEKLLSVSAQLIAQNRQAYEDLAK